MKKKHSNKAYKKLLTMARDIIKTKMVLKAKKDRKVTAKDLDLWIEKHGGAIE
jgi:hypothetical protein